MLLIANEMGYRTNTQSLPPHEVEFRIWSWSWATPFLQFDHPWNRRPDINRECECSLTSMQIVGRLDEIPGVGLPHPGENL